MCLDVLSNRKLLALLLNKKGLLSITFAENGQIAIQIIQEQGLDKFDIIFMDNTMPVMVSTHLPSIFSRKLNS
jgi:CheY-like chemotaxis protein